MPEAFGFKGHAQNIGRGTSGYSKLRTQAIIMAMLLDLQKSNLHIVVKMASTEEVTGELKRHLVKTEHVLLISTKDCSLEEDPEKEQKRSMRSQVVRMTEQ